MIYTKGPWKISQEEYLIESPDRKHDVCQYGDTNRKPAYSFNREERYNNGKILAASVDLFEQAQIVLSACNDYDFFTHGYMKGSASMAEVQAALRNKNAALDALHQTIQKIKHD